MRQVRAVLFATGSLAALVLAGPALAQECSDRLAELESRLTKLEPSSDQRRDLQELIEAARVLEWLEREQGCLTVLSEAEAMLQPAETRAERAVRREEEAVLEEQRDDLEQPAVTSERETPSAPGEDRPADQRATKPQDTATGAGSSGAATPPPAGQDQAAAGDQVQEPGTEDAPAQEQVSRELRSLPPDELIGKEVRDRGGEAVAEVSDLVRQTSDDALFAVLSVGGLLGLGAKEVAVPLSEFELGQENALHLPRRSGDELESLPPFNRTNYARIAE